MSRQATTRRSVTVAASMAAVLLLSVVTLLLLPEGPTQARTSDHYGLDRPSPAVTVTTPFETRLTARSTGLSRVAVAFATYRGSLHCSVDVSLTGADGRAVASRTIDCAVLPDNRLAEVLAFAPERGPAGTQYVLRIALAPGSATNGPSVWTSASGAPDVVQEFGTGTRFVDHLGETVHRMSIFGPPWASAAGLVAMTALVVAGLAVAWWRPRAAVVGVLLLVLARGLLWTALLPPLDGMDEGAHFANVQFIAETGRLPNPAHPFGSKDAYSDSVDVTSDLLHVQALPGTDRPDYTPAAAAAEHRADAAVDTVSNGAGAASGYSPVYYGPAALFYLTAPDDTVRQVEATRLWSVVLGLGTALATWWAATLLFPGSRRAQLALALAASLQPMVAHQSAIVNNDIWVIAWGAAALAMGLRLAVRETRPLLLAGAGAVLGMAVLGKPFGAAVAIPLLLGWGAGVLRRRPGFRAVALDVGAAAGGLVATYGLWLGVARLLGIKVTNGFPPDSGAVGPRTLSAYLQSQFGAGSTAADTRWVRQFWGDFSWVNTPLPSTAYRLLTDATQVLGVLTLAWLVVLVVPRWRRSAGRRWDLPILMCVLYVGGTVAFLYVIEFLYFRACGRTDLLQGRYALLVVPALLALPTLLVARLSAGRIRPALTAPAVLLAALGLHLVSVVVVAHHFYG